MWRFLTGAGWDPEAGEAGDDTMIKYYAGITAAGGGGDGFNHRITQTHRDQCRVKSVQDLIVDIKRDYKKNFRGLTIFMFSTIVIDKL